MRVVAVEYLNTLPFIYGIRCEANGELHAALTLCPPSGCATLAKESRCDVALVPVGALCDMPPQAKIITPYCLSATGKVDTVALLSNCSLKDITTIYLDTDSRTSVKLCQILCKEHWGISPEFITGIPDRVHTNEAVVAIGDKVYDLETTFAHKWDMSQEWQRLTSLPFVFAVWVALTPRGVEAENHLNSALRYGVNNIERALDLCYGDDPLRPRKLDYLTRKIEYELSEEKKDAIKLFLTKIQDL
ncbi:MAG: menaquinone biosynthesis protein [Rikenellaceae bacterium]